MTDVTRKLDSLPTEQQVHVAILCAKRVCDGTEWNEWADAWLSWEDRSVNMAWAASKTALAKEANVATASAATAAWAAVEAAMDAPLASTEATSAARNAIKYALEANPSIDLDEIIQQAIAEESA